MIDIKSDEVVEILNKIHKILDDTNFSNFEKLKILEACNTHISTKMFDDNIDKCKHKKYDKLTYTYTNCGECDYCIMRQKNTVNFLPITSTGA